MTGVRDTIPGSEDKSSGHIATAIPTAVKLGKNVQRREQLKINYSEHQISCMLRSVVVSLKLYLQHNNYYFIIMRRVAYITEFTNFKKQLLYVDNISNKPLDKLY